MRDLDACVVGGEPLSIDHPIFQAPGGFRCDIHDQLAAADELEIARLRDQAAGIVQHEVHDD